MNRSYLRDEITPVVERTLGPSASWHVLPHRGAIVVSVADRSIDIEGPINSDALLSACYRLLGNRAYSALVPENAAEYEAAANGHRLL